MADNSLISWTDSSWPVVVGCEHVSPACDLCYAARLTSTRLKHLPAYAGLAVDGKFTGEVRLLPERLVWPLRWRKPRRIFVCSMSDLFHKDVPDEYIASVFAVMATCPQHTFQVLTKRHARMRSLLSSGKFADLAVDALQGMLDWQGQFRLPAERYDGAARWHAQRVRAAEPMPALPNVWLGVSVEDQHWADLRVPTLLSTPAAVRFLSCEPLLGPVNLQEIARTGASDGGWSAVAALGHGERPRIGAGVDWVIVGGESGSGEIRRMDPDWARALRDQCAAAGVPFWFKQTGTLLAKEWGIPGAGDKRDRLPAEFQIREFPQARRVPETHPG